MRLMRSWFTYLALTALAIGALLFWRVLDHDIDRHISEDFTATIQGDTIVGTLWRPQAQAIAVVMLVHGDGPQDRTSAGGYAPLINALLDHQIAVAAWDKPGVGASTGNWLNQSMADRGELTRAIAAKLRNQSNDSPVGAVGFSQAGWVLPQLTKDDIDFMVLVGPAVSWKDQGRYFTRTRLTLEGAGEAEIEEAIQAATIENEAAFGPNATSDDAPPGMSVDRWAFIKRNRDVDARDFLGSIDTPILAVWGADDLNVDAATDIEIYLSYLSGFSGPSELLYLPDATHGLLKSQPYNWQLVDQWPWYTKLRFFLEGRHAYRPGALNEITDWIHKVSDKQ